MLRHAWILLFSAGLLASGCSQPPAPATPTATASARPDRADREARRKARFEAMDKNHDGKLSDEEKAAAFDEMLKTNERMRDRTDKDGDGTISPEERAEGLKRFMRPRKGGRRHHRPESSPTPQD